MSKSKVIGALLMLAVVGGLGALLFTRSTGAARSVLLYGGAKDPVAIAVKANEFRKALYTGKLLGHLVTLKYGEETQPVIAKVVDMHPVTDEPWHFDLYRVDEHQQIRIAVPVHFRNAEASPGLKRGGTLNVVLHEVELNCPADHIPEEIVHDLTGLDIGETIRISSLKLPAGATPAAGGDVVVATVAGSAAAASAANAEGPQHRLPGGGRHRLTLGVRA